MQTASYNRLIAALICLLGIATAATAQDTRQQNLGDLYQRFLQTQEPEQAIALGMDVLAVEAKTASWTLETPRDIVRMTVHAGLGRAYVNRAGGVRADNVEAAIENFSAALSSTSSVTPAADVAAIHTNLAVAYWNKVRGERVDSQDRSLSHFETALATFTRDSHPLEWAQINSNMGALYLTKLRSDRAANIEKSITCLQDALQILKPETQPQLWAAAHNNLGNAYRVRTAGAVPKNLDAANRHFNEALKVFDKESSPVQWAQVTISIASVLRKQGGPAADDRAIATLRAVLDVFTQTTFPQQWAQTQYELGNALSDKTSGNIAVQRQQAVTAYQAALTVLTVEAAPFNHLQAARRLANVMMQSGDCTGAQPWHATARQAFRLLFSQSLDQTETTSLAAEAGPMFADAAYCAVERGNVDDAAQLANEGRARVLSVALKFQSLNLEPGQKAQVDRLRADIRADQAAVDSTTGADRMAAVDQLSARRRELLEVLDRSSTNTGGPITCASQTRDGSSVKRAIVMPIVTVRGSKMLLCAATLPSWVALDFPDVTLPKIAAILADRSAAGKPGWIEAYFANYFEGDEQERRWPQWLDAVDTIGSQLWELFGEKLAQALRTYRVEPGTQLVLLPSGRLGVLPLGLAQDPSNKQRLIDRFEVVYAPSLDALDTARRHTVDAAPATLAAVVNPTGDLLGAEKEGAIVASHFSQAERTVLLGADATIPAVLAALKGRAYWHFASHGTFVWQDVNSSALIMSRADRLSIGRLAQADGLGRPRLVVLSACETGLPDIVTANPDEFVGLPGSFAALGATGVLGTLWPVSDNATALLIAKFYELHLGKKLTPPAALRSAQIWLRDASTEEIDRFTASQNLKAEHVVEIRQSMDRLAARMGGATKSSGAEPDAHPTSSISEPRKEKPYAHPYYWGGFVYTGL